MKVRNWQLRLSRKRPVPGQPRPPAAAGDLPPNPRPVPAPGPHFTGGLRYTMREDWCTCRRYYDAAGNLIAIDASHAVRPRVPYSAAWDRELQQLIDGQT